MRARLVPPPGHPRSDPSRGGLPGPVRPAAAGLPGAAAGLPPDDPRLHASELPLPTPRNPMKTRVPFLALLLCLLALLPLGCGSEDDVRVGNIRPHVRLTGGIVPQDTVSYTAELFWNGWDDDGVIDHYEYAIDIPAQFTRAEIDDPRPVGIAWRDTTVFRASFLFRVTRPDSVIGSDGRQVPRGRWIGEHTFYVRAIDNEGDTSPAADLTFNATTISPKTTITLPRVVAGGNGILLVGRQVTISWDGVDPDSPNPRPKPVYYEWKLIPVISLINATDPNYIVNESPGPDYPWVRVGGDTTTVRLSLNPPKNYVFAVRAVDEAGAKEDHYDFPRNALRLQSSGAPFVGRPTLICRERTLGTNTFPRDGDVVDYEVPSGRTLRWDFSSDAQSYGGVIQGYNWGVDVADVDAEGPSSGFHGWSLLPYTTEPVRFDRPGTHVVTIKCRDTGGGVTVANYRLRVIDFALDREILYVDDFFLTRDLYTSDDTMDARTIAMLRAGGWTDVRQYQAWGLGDRDGAVTPPQLSELGRYRMLYWCVKGAGGGSQNGASALASSAVCGRLLQAYLSSGGSVWINGQFVFGALKKNEASGLCIANLAYDHLNGFNYGSGDLVCDYLHICGGDIRIAKTTARNLGLSAALPVAHWQGPPLPTVGIDSTQFAAVALGGLPFYDAMFQPTFDLQGGLDTLYTAGTVAPNSSFRNKPIGWSYADPTPVTGSQGPLVVLGFPLPFMKQGSVARGTGAVALARALHDWFAAHAPVRAGAGG